MTSQYDRIFRQVNNIVESCLKNGFEVLEGYQLMDSFCLNVDMEALPSLPTTIVGCKEESHICSNIVMVDNMCHGTSYFGNLQCYTSHFAIFKNEILCNIK